MHDLDGNPIGITPKQLAHRLGVTEETLYNWRRRGNGPPYFKISGVIYYQPDDVTNWIRSKRVA